jgi:hypothetical protein
MPPVAAPGAAACRACLFAPAFVHAVEIGHQQRLALVVCGNAFLQQGKQLRQ